MPKRIRTHTQAPGGDVYAVTVQPGTQVTASPDVVFFKTHTQTSAIDIQFTGSGPTDTINLVIPQDVALELLRAVLGTGVLPDRLMADIRDLARARAT
jgi:hypothetical protein